MRKIFSFLLLLSVSTTLSAQYFEGKLVYHNTYKSKTDGVSDDQFTEMLGNTMTYYIKGNQFRTEMNGQMVLWQLYNPADNKLYTKMSNSETLFWNDAAVNDDEVLDVQVNKNVTEILGYSCDEIIFKTKEGTQKYYYSSKLSVDASLFTNHKYGNWYDFVSRSGAVPLKFIDESPEFVMESTAVEIKPMQVDKSLFTLPAGVQSVKSPF